MNRTSATEQGNRQPADNPIRPLDANVPEAERKCINVLFLELADTLHRPIPGCNKVVESPYSRSSGITAHEKQANQRKSDGGTTHVNIDNH